MEAIKKANKYTGKVVLILCNIVLLLRAVPIDAMKKLWLFPVNYPAAEIGLIDQRGWRAVTPTTASIVISLFASILP